MVVGYRGPQLFKTGTTLTFCNKLPLGLSNSSFGYNNYSSLCLNSASGKSKVPLVRLWRNCRRLRYSNYSKETSRSMTKLSPPECSLAFVSQVTSNQLTKEADLQLYNSLDNSDTNEQFVNLFFRSAPQAIENVNSLLLTRSVAINVPDVVDSFNTGIQYNVLEIVEGSVKVNPAVLEKALLQLAKDVVKTLFPNDPFQQLMAYSVIQKQIKDTTKQLQPVIDQSKIPVAVLSAAISEPAYKVAKVQTRAGLLSGLQHQICNVTVGYVCSLINGSLTNAETMVSSISVSGSSNVVLAKLIELLVSLAKEILSTLKSANQSVESLLCNSLLGTARRRRDVEVVSGRFGRSISESVGTRSISSVVTNLLNKIWTAIANVLKKYVVSLVTSMFGLLQKYIENWLATVLASVIASINQLL